MSRKHDTMPLHRNDDEPSKTPEERIQELESALALTAAKYEALRNSIDEGVVFFEIQKDGTHGTLQEFNDAVLNRYGYTPDELTGMNVHDLDVMHKLKTVNEERKFHRNNKTTFDTIQQGKDGICHPLTIHASKIGFEDKKYILSVMQPAGPSFDPADIDPETENRILIGNQQISNLPTELTEQARRVPPIGSKQEATAHEKAREFRSVFEGAPTGMFIYRLEPDGELMLLDANPEALRQLGLPRESIVGKSLTKSFPHMALPSYDSALRNAIVKGVPWQEQQLLFEGGVVSGVFDVSVFKSIENHAVVMFNNVTETVLAQHKIKDSQELFHTLFRDNSSIMFMLDPETHTFLQVNRAACEFYGYKEQEMLNMSVEDMLPQNGPTPVPFITALTSGGRGPLTMLHRHASGELRHVEVFGGPISFSSKKAVYAVVRDISEQLSWEKELKESRKKALSASQAKSEFLANMSHEIRTPLNGLLGMLQLMQATELDEDQTKFTETALIAGRSLLKILNDIMDLSKVEAGKLVLDVRPFSIRELFQYLREHYAPIAQDTDISMRFSLDCGKYDRIRGDVTRIRQSLQNLIENSIKFTKQGWIKVRAKVNEDEQRVYFDVEDTGIGIEQKMQETIFEKFSQGDPSYTREFSGAGLGLSIVQKLIALMDGNITLDSTPDRGTCIRLSLPLLTAEAVRENSESDTAAPKLSPYSVLLVEDDATNAFVLSRYLVKHGLEVSQAENGAKALEALDNGSFDIVLMDIQMPIMDGLEATRRIRQGQCRAISQDIPVIALTAHAMSGDREEFLTQGMDDYHSKPVDMDALLRSIDRLVNQ